MNVSVVDIMNALVPAQAFAKDLAQAHPKHADAVAQFVSEIGRIANELKASVYGARSPE